MRVATINKLAILHLINSVQRHGTQPDRIYHKRVIDANEIDRNYTIDVSWHGNYRQAIDDESADPLMRV